MVLAWPITFRLTSTQLGDAAPIQEDLRFIDLDEFDKHGFLSMSSPVIQNVPFRDLEVVWAYQEPGPLTVGIYAHVSNKNRSYVPSLILS
jgi:hypothetical protein